MVLQVDLGWLLTTMLASIRIAAATLLAPVFGLAKIPASVKVLLGLTLSACLVSALALPGPGDNVTLAALLRAALREATIGLAFGFGFMAAHAATQVAGRILDVQVGFGAASVLNPATQVPSPLIGTLFGMTMVAAFLALDGHHLLIRALTSSLIQLPPNSIADFDVIGVIRQSAVMFSFGLALAAPVMFMLLLSDVAMAVFARSMPQLNVLLLSFAVKIIVGVVGLALTIGLTRALFDGLFESTFVYWNNLAGRP